MLQLGNIIRITTLLVLSFTIQTQCCKRDDLYHVKITEAPKPLDASKKVVNTFSLVGNIPRPLIVALEGLSPCRENIQEYEENVKLARVIEVHNHFVPILRYSDVQNMEYLENLYLDDNTIQEIEPETFLNIPKIRIVSLINNTIKEIQRGVFSNLNIEKLYLHNNQISKIASEAFDNMPNLIEIDLSNNLLTNWNSNWLSSSPKVTKLLLNFNELFKIPEKAFSNIKNSLEVLDLSNNKIDVIDAITIRELKNLRKLSLENNNFKCLSDDVVEAFPAHLTLSVAPNDNLQCLCWSKLEKWSFKYYPENKDTIFFTVRHAEIQCNNEIVGMLHDTLSRISALEKH